MAGQAANIASWVERPSRVSTLGDRIRRKRQASEAVFPAYFGVSDLSISSISTPRPVVEWDEPPLTARMEM
jgi:anaerobic glycerol-3-phosphate dehydrogenase